MNSSWPRRLFGRLPLAKEAEDLKRNHFKQQSSILTRVRAIEMAARSSLDTDASLMQACHQLLETLGDLRQQTAKLTKQIAHLPRELGVNVRASRQLPLIEEMQRLAARVGELAAGRGETRVRAEEMTREARKLAPALADLVVSQERSRAHTEAVNQDVQKVLVGVGELLAVREESRVQANELNQEMQKLLASVGVLVAGRQESRVQAEGLNHEMHKLLAGVEEVVAGREESRVQVNGLIQEMQKLLADVGETTRVQRGILAESHEIREIIGKLHQPGGVRLMKVSDYGLANPEVGLMQHLCAFLPNRVAVDVGAHVGEISRRLLDVGYEVYAFEPFSPVFQRLCELLGTVQGFRATPVAIGPEDGDQTLNLVTDTTVDKVFGDVTLFSSLVRHATPNGLEFTEELPVRMRSLDSLWREGEIPREVGLVKIDTEGFDLEVIRGMGEHRPPLVIAEFWDVEAAIGGGLTSNRLHDLVGEMRGRGYHWHIVMYRVDGSEDVSYFVNRAVSVPQSWGNVLFFQQHDVFAEAVRWCAAMLPVTHFTA